MRLFPCTFSSLPRTRAGALNKTHLPLSLLEVPLSSPPCSSHIFQSEPLLSYERGSLRLGIQTYSCRIRVLTHLGRNSRRALSSHTAPTTHNHQYYGAAAPHKWQEETWTLLTVPPFLPSSAQSGILPTLAVLKMRSQWREGRKGVLKNYYYYCISSGKKTSPLVKGRQPPAQIFVPTAVAEPKYWHAS